MNRRNRGGQAFAQRRALVATCIAMATALVVGCTPPDFGPGEPGPRDCVPQIGTPQIILPLPGLFLPLPSIKGLSEFDDLAPAPAALSLPATVDLRDNSQGFNSYAEFALAGGSVYTRPRGSTARWRKVPTPGCLDGNIVALSVDSNMAVALDSDGWIYTLDNVLSGPMLWNWSRSFGAPIWTHPGMKVPGEALAPGKWAISHRVSESFIDAKGYKHPTTAGLVQLVSLTGGGSRIVFQDPWLPADYSYEIGGPIGGRFISESISGSGSVTFVMNRFGDMYTRKYDLDLAGANHIPGRYTWQEQGDLPSAPDQWQERTNPAYAAISLPAEDWQHQPKIPGEVTARISISQTGARMEDRELRVEGRSGGTTGYWHKQIAASQWDFTPTAQTLAMAILTEADPRRDQSTVELAPQSEVSYTGSLGSGWTATLDHFDWAQTKHDVTLTAPSGRRYGVRLYTTDSLRFDQRASGLDNNPRFMEGAFDVRGAKVLGPDELDPRTSDVELSDFVRTRFEGSEVFEVWIQATAASLEVSPARFFAGPLATLRRV